VPLVLIYQLPDKPAPYLRWAQLVQDGGVLLSMVHSKADRQLLHNIGCAHNIGEWSVAVHLKPPTHCAWHARKLLHTCAHCLFVCACRVRANGTTRHQAAGAGRGAPAAVQLQ
jgi:hypothetical protein